MSDLGNPMNVVTLNAGGRVCDHVVSNHQLHGAGICARSLVHACPTLGARLNGADGPCKEPLCRAVLLSPRCQDADGTVMGDNFKLAAITCVVITANLSLLPFDAF